MAAAILRVRPIGDLPVPLGDGRRVLRTDSPPGGFIVPDDMFHRRRIMFGELELLAEGDAALPPPDPSPTKTAAKGGDA